jgi:cysteine synthase
VVVMGENFSLERRRMLRFLGARVVLTPAALKGTGMMAKAEELAAKHKWFLCRQFENEANAAMHSRTTAPEILADFAGDRLDYWVTGYGTGGTLKGVGGVLRAQRPQTKIVVCEPDNSQILGSGIAQPRTAEGAHAGSHPNFRPHVMQGWGPDFIPQLTEEAIRLGLIDRIVPVGGADALRLARELAQKEGIFTGITGGATLAGALKVCESAPEGTTVLCMLPDTGERYLSTPLFADVPTDMTEEEWEISRSTPTGRFDVCSTAPPPAPVSPPTVIADAHAQAFFAAAIGDPRQPVVMFAFEWCEFCWSLRRMFAAYGISYRSVDIDSVQYQKDNQGGKIRAALAAHTSINTIPQVFVGGEFLGGCSETLEACKSGRLQELLKKNGVAFDEGARADPFGFLPAWRHPK